MSARDKLRAYFEEHVGEIVETRMLKEVGGISEYARRIRELRDDEGMQILSHKDRHDLKSGQYILISADRVPRISSGIHPQLRLEILERNGFTCQLCGAGAGDSDPYNPRRKVVLHIDHIKPKSQGGTDDRSNLRVLCSTCNQAKANIGMPTETTLNLLARFRRAPRDTQKEVYEQLKKRFGKDDQETGVTSEEDDKDTGVINC
ncbi:MAG: HNH endonuclease [Candidatus Altiarchaeota archaeon]|nr:HNH endonuclease [Candidatus Altiarchaeota archaeon]